MRFLHWLTRNWADTDEPGDPTLTPPELQLPPAEALRFAEELIRQLPRWQVEASDPEKGTIHATRRTRLWRFVDDIRLRLEPTPEGVRIHARSQSRLGKGDLGQNRRNLLELFAVLHGGSAR
jgi:uncharacterized protein (DUF1499 family)